MPQEMLPGFGPLKPLEKPQKKERKPVRYPTIMASDLASTHVEHSADVKPPDVYGAAKSVVGEVYYAHLIEGIGALRRRTGDDIDAMNQSVEASTSWLKDEKSSYTFYRQGEGRLKEGIAYSAQQVREIWNSSQLAKFEEGIRISFKKRIARFKMERTIPLDKRLDPLFDLATSCECTVIHGAAARFRVDTADELGLFLYDGFTARAHYDLLIYDPRTEKVYAEQAKFVSSQMAAHARSQHLGEVYLSQGLAQTRINQIRAGRQPKVPQQIPLEALEKASAELFWNCFEAARDEMHPIRLTVVDAQKERGRAALLSDVKYWIVYGEDIKAVRQKRKEQYVLPYKMTNSIADLVDPLAQRLIYVSAD